MQFFSFTQFISPSLSHLHTLKHIWHHLERTSVFQVSCTALDDRCDMTSFNWITLKQSHPKFLNWKITCPVLRRPSDTLKQRKNQEKRVQVMTWTRTILFWEVYGCRKWDSYNTPIRVGVCATSPPSQFCHGCIRAHFEPRQHPTYTSHFMLVKSAVPSKCPVFWYHHVQCTEAVFAYPATLGYRVQQLIISSRDCWEQRTSSFSPEQITTGNFTTLMKTTEL